MTRPTRGGARHAKINARTEPTGRHNWLPDCSSALARGSCGAVTSSGSTTRSADSENASAMPKQNASRCSSGNSRSAHDGNLELPVPCLLVHSA